MFVVGVGLNVVSVLPSEMAVIKSIYKSRFQVKGKDG